MKTYIKPAIEQIDLRSEERFAAGSPCPINGSCSDAEIALMASKGLLLGPMYG